MRLPPGFSVGSMVVNHGGLTNHIHHGMVSYHGLTMVNMASDVVSIVSDAFFGIRDATS